MIGEHTRDVNGAVGLVKHLLPPDFSKRALERIDRPPAQSNNSIGGAIKAAYLGSSSPR
jgi:hypothetical protein